MTLYRQLVLQRHTRTVLPQCHNPVKDCLPDGDVKVRLSQDSAWWRVGVFNPQIRRSPEAVSKVSLCGQTGEPFDHRIAIGLRVGDSVIFITGGK